MGFYTIYRTILGKLDQLSGYKLCDGKCGVEYIAKKNKIPYKVINDSNSEEFIEEVKKREPDVILSFSAPQIIKEPLLSLPKHGILNVHGSYLPYYRGCMPSFFLLLLILLDFEERFNLTGRSMFLISSSPQSI